MLSVDRPYFPLMLLNEYNKSRSTIAHTSDLRTVFEIAAVLETEGAVDDSAADGIILLVISLLQYNNYC